MIWMVENNGMETIHLDHSSVYTITIHDPRMADFSVTLYPCEVLDCREDGDPERTYCCRGRFTPLTDAAIERLKRDWEDLRNRISIGSEDIECRVLSEVLQTLTTQIKGTDRTIDIPGLIPLIIRRCAANALYEVYIRTVPYIVETMEAEGIAMPRARSILDRGEG